VDRGVAVVTGAAGGLGLAVASALHRDGYAVHLTDVDGPAVTGAARRLGAASLAALAVMREAGRGHVVNVVSLAGLIAPPGETVYAASKHAVLAFSVGTLADLRAAGVRGVHISCVCPDGMWTPMLHDRLADDGAAASFTGVLLPPERVAARVARLVARLRPVVAVPRWRGAQVRVLGAFPGAFVRLARPVLAVGRAAQRRHLRRIARGETVVPPG